MKKLCTIILSFLLLATAVTALSASIGNGRMILYPEVVEGKETIIERTILVKNINDVSVKVELTAHGDLEDMAEIIDKELILEPQQSAEARFKITVTEPGTYEGNIAVAFSEYPESADGSGVGLLSKIVILADQAESSDSTEESTEQQEDNQPNPLVGVGLVSLILLIGIVAFLALKRKNRRSPKTAFGSGQVSQANQSQGKKPTGKPTRKPVKKTGTKKTKA